MLIKFEHPFLGYIPEGHIVFFYPMIWRIASHSDKYGNKGFSWVILLGKENIILKSGEIVRNMYAMNTCKIFYVVKNFENILYIM